MHRAASTIEGLSHLVHGVERAGDRRERSGLGDVGDIAGRVRLQILRGLDQISGTDHPADTPTCHRVGLGDAVQDDDLVAEFGDERGH